VFEMKTRQYLEQIEAGFVVAPFHDSAPVLAWLDSVAAARQKKLP
jgi:hypothetical protein